MAPNGRAVLCEPTALVVKVRAKIFHRLVVYTCVVHAMYDRGRGEITPLHGRQRRALCHTTRAVCTCSFSLSLARAFARSYWCTCGDELLNGARRKGFFKFYMCVEVAGCFLNIELRF